MSTANLMEQRSRREQPVAVAAAALALAAAAIYLVIAAGWAPDGLQTPPRPIMLVAGIAYLTGGMLIPRRDRRLLTLGAVANALVIVAFFVSLALGRSDLAFLSLASKLIQAVLEGLLLWLRRAPQRQLPPSPVSRLTTQR